MRKWLWLCALVLTLSGCTQIEHKSDAPEKKPLAAIDSVVNVRRLWAASAGGGVGKSDAKLQLAGYGANLYTVDHDGDLIAINKNSGKEMWRLALKHPVSAGPTVGENRLVVGTSDAKVIAVDLDKAKIAWITSTSSEILAAPRISNDMVFVHTMDGGLNCLSLIDGRQLWRFSHSLPPLMLRRASSPAVSKESVIAGFASGKLLSMRMQDGSIEWIQDVGQPKGRNDLQRMVDISADPVVKGDTVYASSYQGNLVALNVETGHPKWERQIPSYSGFSLDNKFIYVAETDGNVAALDETNGASYWLQDELHGRRLSTPVLMGKYIVIADEDGYIHWLEKASGKIVGRFQLDKDGVEAAPVVNNNIVYVLGRSGKLVALEVN